MPAEVEYQPLRVGFVFSDASTYVARLDGLGWPARRRVVQLAVGLANLAQQHGGLNAAKSVIEYRTRIGQLVRWLEPQRRSGSQQLRPYSDGEWTTP